MIREKAKNNYGPIKPYYELTFEYMIGDADGDAKEKVDVALDNPHLERFYKLVSGLERLPGKIGVVLDHEDLKKQLSLKKITEDDYEFLKATMFESVDSTYWPIDANDEKYDAFGEFFEGVRYHIRNSFLTFDGFKLERVNADGTKTEMEVV